MTPQQTRTERKPVRGPTDPGLGVTGIVAAGVTVVFYLAVLPLLGEQVGALFAERGRVPYAIAFLSFWAFVLLAEKFRRFTRQREAMAFDLLPARLGERISPDNARHFVDQLETLPPRARDGLLARRVRRALHHFEARRDAREVVASLESQAQTDADAVDSSYTMVRAFIWAVPVLGFIGTVIGIGAAVGGFSDSIGAAVDLDVMKDSIGSVTGGLSVAFDTTLLALVMSILIMFPASSLQKMEEGFLADVEDYCDEHLVRRLEDGAGEGPPEERWIREAVAAELAPHHEALRQWQERLEGIGETLTAQVLAGWEKIDEQLRMRQDRQQERLSDWASARQREAAERRNLASREVAHRSGNLLQLVRSIASQTFTTDRVTREAEVAADAGVELGDILVFEGVGEAEHPHGVGDLGEGFGGGGANLVGRAVGAFEMGETRLNRRIAGFERVILRVGDRRGVFGVIGGVGLGQALRQVGQFFRRLRLGRVVDRWFLRHLAPPPERGAAGLPRAPGLSLQVIGRGGGRVQTVRRRWRAACPRRRRDRGRGARSPCPRRFRYSWRRPWPRPVSCGACR